MSKPCEVAEKAAKHIKDAEAKVVKAAIRQCGEILEPGKAQWLLRCAVDALMDARNAEGGRSEQAPLRR